MLSGLTAAGFTADSIEALFDGAVHGPAVLSDAERSALRAAPAGPPAWLLQSMARAYGESAEAELAAMTGRAPLDLRANALKATVGSALAALIEDGIVAEALPGPSGALRVVAGQAGVDASRAHRDGLVEIQDAGSQTVAALIEAAPGMTVLDLCTGAGGKALAAAGQMRNVGRIVAADIASVRLKRLPPRAARAGATIITPILLPPDWLDGPPPFAERFDRVVLDAPCSGSGTWRRNPETRARLTQEAVADLAALQMRLLDASAALVAPGGRLIFVTCSMLAEEGEDHIAPFLARHPGFRLHGTVHRLGPASTDTDGFFAAVLQRDTDQGSGEVRVESGSGGSC